jgi:hypothetical protein
VKKIQIEPLEHLLGRTLTDLELVKLRQVESLAEDLEVLHRAANGYHRVKAQLAEGVRRPRDQEKLEDIARNALFIVIGMAAKLARVALDMSNEDFIADLRQSDPQIAEDFLKWRQHGE